MASDRMSLPEHVRKATEDGDADFLRAGPAARRKGSLAQHGVHPQRHLMLPLLQLVYPATRR